MNSGKGKMVNTIFSTSTPLGQASGCQELNPPRTVLPPAPLTHPVMVVTLPLKNELTVFWVPYQESTHTLQVCETCRTACLKVKHKLTFAAQTALLGRTYPVLPGRACILYLLPVISCEHLFPVLSFNC